VAGGGGPHPGGDARACTSKRFYDPGVLRLNRITFACERPDQVAEFWGAVVGYAVGRMGESWTADDPRGEGPELFFHRMTKSPTIEVPIHLDVNVPDREAEVERLRGLGAYIVETKTSAVGDFSETCTVMRDVEGNGFCVQEPQLRKAYPYIGNVTFSSAEPKRLGAFWTEALGWEEEEPESEFIERLLRAGLDPHETDAFYATRHPDGSRPRFLFQRREKSRPESYPIHVDFRADDREGEIARLIGIGATVVETKAARDKVWTVLRDPEENPFCIE
jgi:predicted enzyme related to lactoylglutathione lyase